MDQPRNRVVRSLASIAATLLLVLGLGVTFASPAAAALPPGIPSNSAAQSQLNSLTVAAEGSGSGYDRSLFPHWNNVDGNCNARQYVLRRDGTNVQTDSNCQPTSGQWYSDFDGVTTTDASTFDIDHLVALAEAWRSGASSWSTDQRRQFANDVSSPQLWAVTASSNRSKGDSDPANWMPPRAAVHCDYVKAWINVKYRYDLTVDSAERSALQSTLNSAC